MDKRRVPKSYYVSYMHLCKNKALHVGVPVTLYVKQPCKIPQFEIKEEQERHFPDNVPRDRHDSYIRGKCNSQFHILAIILSVLYSLNLYCKVLCGFTVFIIFIMNFSIRTLLKVIVSDKFIFERVKSVSFRHLLFVFSGV
jgi:hypothetical protein